MLGDVRIEGDAICCVGLIYLDQQNFGEVRSYLEKGLKLVVRSGYQRRQSRYLVALSRACRELDDFEAAYRHAEEALALSERIGHRKEEAALELGKVRRAIEGSGRGDVLGEA